MSKIFLSKTELEIMQYIWNNNSEVTASEIRNHFSAKNWSKQTVGVFLKKLVNANFLSIRCESSNKYYYSATLTEQEYSMLPAKEVLKNVFNNSFSNFACALFSSDDATEENIHRLEELLATYKKELADKQAQSNFTKIS